MHDKFSKNKPPKDAHTAQTKPHKNRKKEREKERKKERKKEKSDPLTRKVNILSFQSLQGMADKFINTKRGCHTGDGEEGVLASRVA